MYRLETKWLDEFTAKEWRDFLTKEFRPFSLIILDGIGRSVKLE